MRLLKKDICNLSDKDIIEQLLLNNEQVIEYLFYKKCKAMFSHIIKEIFSYQVDKNELISELYLYLRDNDWYKLRQFDYRSKLTTWLSVVAIRFFQKRRDELIEKTSKSSLNNKTDEIGYDATIQTIQRIDITEILKRLSNERYRYVIQALVLDDKEPKEVADKMGITVDNLYNIKRRALLQLTQLFGKGAGYDK